MYKCLHCGHEFEDIDRKHYDHGTGVWEEYCPNCGSEDFEEAEQCELCGEWHVADKVHNGVCDDCLQKAETMGNVVAFGNTDKQEVELNGFLAWAFTPSEIEDILINELLKSKDLANNYMHNYVMNDPYMFARHIKEGEE